jgi:hypothetical protein
LVLASGGSSGVLFKAPAEFDRGALGWARRSNRKPGVWKIVVQVEGPEMGQHLVGLLEGVGGPRVCHVDHAHSFKGKKALVLPGMTELAVEGAPDRAKLADKGEGEHFSRIKKTAAGLTEAGAERGANADATNMVPNIAAREDPGVGGESTGPEAAGEMGTGGRAERLSAARARG